MRLTVAEKKFIRATWELYNDTYIAVALNKVRQERSERNLSERTIASFRLREGLRRNMRREGG